MDETIKIAVRPANPTDRGFVMSNWLRGQRFGCEYFHRMDQAAYYEQHGNLVTTILGTPGTQVDVASDENAPLWAVGFAVTRGEELYWIFVKRDFRHRGIATLLLKGKEITRVRATTTLGLSIVKQKHLTYVPI